MINTIVKFLKFVYKYKSVIEYISNYLKGEKTTNKIPVDTLEQKSLDVYNEFLQKAGKPPLNLSTELCRAAAAHAEWMNINKKASHIGSFGTTFRNRAKNAGYKGMYIAEHIFVCPFSNETTIISKNLLGTTRGRDTGFKFTDFGIGRSGNYWCILLGM